VKQSRLRREESHLNEDKNEANREDEDDVDIAVAWEHTPAEMGTRMARSDVDSFLEEKSMGVTTRRIPKYEHILTP
jgi:hypothetical protein